MLLEQIAQEAPGEALRGAVTDAVGSGADALAPTLAAEAGGDGSGDRAAGLVEMLCAAEQAQGRVHGLTGTPLPAGRGGKDAAALAGGWLRARATEVAAEIGPEALALQSQALTRIAAGWILEAEDLYDAGRLPERYLQAATATRGSLCSLAAALGGIAAGRDGRDLEALASYGQKVGAAAKIADDTAALVPALVPAPGVPGDAITRGVYTLPVILAVGEQTSLATRLGGAIKPEALDQLVIDIREAGGPGRAARRCRALCEEATATIEGVDGADWLGAIASEVAIRCEETALA